MFATLFSTLLGLPLFFGSVTVQSYICQPPDKPVIVTPADGSKLTAGAVTFSGTATASSQVTLSVDGQAAAQVTADAYNNFQAQVTLGAGSHTVGIASTSPCGDATGDYINLTASAPPIPPSSSGGSSQSQLSPPPATTSASLSSNSTPPPDNTSAPGQLLLTVTTPHDGATTKQASILVRGVTSAPAKVQIAVNGTVVAQTFQLDTSFGLSVPLNTGNNTVTISATGNDTLASVTLHITRIAASNPPASTTRHTPWWRTAPGIVTISASIIVVLRLVTWLSHLRLTGASKRS